MKATGTELAAAVLSNLFRVATYIFLRVIPATHLKLILPSLFAGYASCLYLSPPAATTQNTTVKTEEKSHGKDKPNGVHAHAVTPQDSSPRTLLLSVLLSLPSPLKLTRLLTLGLNLILLNFSLDLLFAPLLDPARDVMYARLGAVSADSAKISLRVPFQNATEGSVHVIYRQVLSNELLSTASSSWQEGAIATVTEGDDWTTVVKLSGLWPSTQYEFRLSSPEKYILPVPAEAIPFKTFPDSRLPTGSRFRFIVSSCSTPNFPYVPFAGRQIKGYDLLAEYLWPTPSPEQLRAEALSVEDIVLGKEVPPPEVPVSTEVVDPTFTSLTVVDTETTTLADSTTVVATETSDVPITTPIANASAPELEVKLTVQPPIPAEFMLFLGDFVYADVPAFWGDDEEAYRRLYRRTYNSPSFRKVYEKLPIFNAYDDHEIINNFAGLGNDSAPYANASGAWALYNGAANPDATDHGEHYYDFRYADVAFFVMDTRRHRSDVSSTEEHERTVLGANQLAALYEWLGKVNQTTTFKFIVTSVPFTSLWTHDAQTDSWAGFTKEKETLLNALQSVPNVVMLSGDRHEAAVIEFAAPTNISHKIFEISTSPLSMFYVPFVRTLKSVSEETIQRVRNIVTQDVDEEGNEVVVTVEEVEEVPRERVLNYTPIGNYKWSAIEIDTLDLDHPKARLELVADGKVAYKLEIEGTPVKLKSTTAIGQFVPSSFSQLLRQLSGRIGFDPTKWF